MGTILWYLDDNGVDSEEDGDDNRNYSGKTEETATGRVLGDDNEETPKNITPL